MLRENKADDFPKLFVREILINPNKTRFHFEVNFGEGLHKNNSNVFFFSKIQPLQYLIIINQMDDNFRNFIIAFIFSNNNYLYVQKPTISTTKIAKSSGGSILFPYSS